MGKNKQLRFDEISRLENVLEHTDFEDLSARMPRGEWSGRIFQNGRPIVLELACGKGEYTVNLALKYPQRNFVGVDIKGARIWKGARQAADEEIPNVRFLRIFIDHLADYFAPGEVDEIWIPFPDPYLKSRKSDKRLTSDRFLDLYRRILRPGAPIHLKTDSPTLFQFTLETLTRQRCRILDLVEDVYRDRPGDDLLSIRTFYEKSHLEQGRKIRYVKFCLSPEEWLQEPE